MVEKPGMVGTTTNEERYRRHVRNSTEILAIELGRLARKCEHRPLPLEVARKLLWPLMALRAPRLPDEQRQDA
jgi:hypothetical protein